MRVATRIATTPDGQTGPLNLRAAVLVAPPFEEKILDQTRPGLVAEHDPGARSAVCGMLTGAGLDQ